MSVSPSVTSSATSTTVPSGSVVTPVSVVVPALVSGVLMAVYLLLRPYGDFGAGDTLAAAEAFASPLWVLAHVAGAAALVALAVLWAGVARGPIRWAAIGGVAMVLPYYGAETFALHEIGTRAVAGETALLDLVAPVRDNPVAMTLFGVGLLALAAAGIGAALVWRRAHTGTLAGTALLPLAVVAAAFLPQFFLPPVGRIAYGLLFAAAAGYAAFAVTTGRASTTSDTLRANSL